MKSCCKPCCCCCCCCLAVAAVVQAVDVDVSVLPAVVSVDIAGSFDIDVDAVVFDVDAAAESLDVAAVSTLRLVK